MHYPLITHFFTTFLVTRAIIHTKHFARQNTIPPPLFWPCSSPPDICSGVGGASLALILVVPESQATNAFSPHFDESLRGVLCGGLEVTATATLSTSVSGPTITYLVCVFQPTRVWYIAKHPNESCSPPTDDLYDLFPLENDLDISRQIDASPGLVCII